MNRCKSCKRYNKEKSNRSYVMCSDMPKDVIWTGSSEHCKNYEAVELTDGGDDE